MQTDVLMVVKMVVTMVGWWVDSLVVWKADRTAVDLAECWASTKAGRLVAPRAVQTVKQMAVQKAATKDGLLVE